MLETIPVYESGADFSGLEGMESRVIYVTPSHHSPYGLSMSIQKRQKLIQWANKIDGSLNALPFMVPKYIPLPSTSFIIILTGPLLNLALVILLVMKLNLV